MIPAPKDLPTKVDFFQSLNPTRDKLLGPMLLRLKPIEKGIQQKKPSVKISGEK